MLLQSALVYSVTPVNFDKETEKSRLTRGKPRQKNILLLFFSSKPSRIVDLFFKIQIYFKILLNVLYRVFFNTYATLNLYKAVHLPALFCGNS